jgi:hypothetical protein
MIIYYIDGKKYIAKKYQNIPIYKISSPDENIPAYENLDSGFKYWCKKGDIFHRLTGPSTILADGTNYFYLNNKRYMNIREWINNHPNPDLYFDAIGLNETDKVLWFLQN